MSVVDDSLLTARLADAIADNADLFIVRSLLIDAGITRPPHHSTAEWLAALIVRGARQRTIMRRPGEWSGR